MVKGEIMLTIIVVSTFVSIAFIVMAVYWVLFRPVSATAQRLHELGRSTQDGGGTEYRSQHDGIVGGASRGAYQPPRATFRRRCKEAAQAVDAGRLSIAFGAGRVIE